MTIVVHGKDIVAELDAIYQDALQNLRSAMLRFAADGPVPGPEALAQRLFCYPALRITHVGSWDAVPLVRYFARLSAPGVFVIPLTRPTMNAAYLPVPIALLLPDYGLLVEVAKH